MLESPTPAVLQGTAGQKTALTVPLPPVEFFKVLAFRIQGFGAHTRTIQARHMVGGLLTSCETVLARAFSNNTFPKE